MTTNNHPAHGPVSLERLHQISEILSKASAQSDGGNLGYAMADAVKVIDEVLELRRNYLALRGEIEDVQAQLYEAENRNEADATELQERRKADSAEPVSFDELSAAVAEVTGGNQHVWNANIYKGHHDVPFMNYNSLARIVDKYRAPQSAPDSEAQATLKRLAVILHGSETDLNLLTVTAQSLIYRCKAPARERDDLHVPHLASEREQVRREHAAWSKATFGNVGPVGPLKHLSKEALEAAAEPGDLSEWADMQFLLWDAQRRAGISDEQITLAMVEKLAVNKQREWPEPKDGEPRLHIKTEQQQGEK